MKFKEIHPSENETYQVKVDDSSLVVKVGERIMYLSKAMCEWIGKNKDKMLK